MVTTTQVQPIPQITLEDIGMTWHTDTDGSAYLVPELVNVSEAEAQAFYDASNILYDHFVEAAEHVINEKRYAELGIDPALISLIEDSWERDDWHLYGRFDLAGGLDGKPIKLIEFNADTPTSLYETAILQWALLKANNMDEAAQFNNIHTMLQENFRRLITKDQSDFATSYHSEKFLFSSIAGLDEDERTVRYLQHVAHEAGLFTDFCFLDEAGFLENQGVFNRDQQRADFWFKLFPWEDIASEEPELVSIFQSFSQLNSTSIVNPAYTLLFQSKGLLPILSELFPRFTLFATSKL
jgi:glutathionylspermidine synthase